MTLFSQKPVRVMDLRGTYKGGGGPDKTVLNSAARHDPARVQLLVTYLKRPDDAEFAIAEMAAKAGVPNYVDLPDRSMIDLRCLMRLRALVLEHDLHLLHAHDDKTLLYGWLLRCLLPQLRIIYTCHSHPLYSRSDFGSFKSYLRFRLRKSIQLFLMRRYLEPVIAVSRDTRERLVADGLAADGIAVLHNGIDTSSWDPRRGRPVLREELSIPSDALVVGTVARITYDKDLPTFYDVAERVARRERGVRFVIVGDGYGDELQRARLEVARRGLEAVVLFTGHRSDLLDVYASFDLFLMTSLTEGLPNTLLEAMAMGLPAVSTAVGGIPELLADGEGGYLAPVGDAAGLADRVLQLLADSRLRERFGEDCRRRVEREFSFEGRVRRMEELYHCFNDTAHPAHASSLSSC